MFDEARRSLQIVAKFNGSKHNFQRVRFDTEVDQEREAVNVTGNTNSTDENTVDTIRLKG